jgi:hypothetical protein
VPRLSGGDGVSQPVNPHADLRCPHVGECAHPKAGRVNALGECVDCGLRVAAPAPAPRLRDRLSSEDFEATLATYDGPAEFTGGWSW